MCKSISVIMPNYNDALRITDALEAICQQSYCPLEVIVVDNCSTDQSIEVIKRLQAKYPFIQLIQNDSNYGHSYSVNKGVKLACGDYVYIASSNDRVLPGFFEKCMDMFNQHPQAGICFADFQIINVVDGSKTVNHWRDYKGYYSPEQLAKLARQTQTVFAAGPDTILRRNLLPAEVIYNPQIYIFSDWFLSKIVAFRYGACYIPETLVSLSKIENSLADKVFKDQLIFEQQCAELIKLFASMLYEDIIPLVINSRCLRNIIPKMRTPDKFLPAISSVLQENRNCFANVLIRHLAYEYLCDLCEPVIQLVQATKPTLQLLKNKLKRQFYFSKNVADRLWAQLVANYDISNNSLKEFFCKYSLGTGEQHTSDNATVLSLLLLSVVLVAISFAVSFAPPRSLWAHGCSALNPFLYLKFLPYNSVNQKFGHILLLLLTFAGFFLVRTKYICLSNSAKSKIYFPGEIVGSLVLVALVLSYAAEFNLTFFCWCIQAYIIWGISKCG